MKKIKAPLKDVLGDDMSKPFWQSIHNNPNWQNYERELDYILNQSLTHNKPFKDIDPEDLDPYDWKLK